MLINWKKRSPLFGVIVILLVQLATSVGCFYSYSKAQSAYEVRITKIEKLVPTISEMKCDQINKDVVLTLLNGSAVDVKEFANVLLWFGIVLGWTSGLSLLLLFRNKTKLQAG